MDTWTLLFIGVAAAVVLLALLAILLRGNMSTRFRLGDMEVKADASRDQPSNSGRAVIANSRSKDGGASASGQSSAEIRRTRARGDLVANAGENRVIDPKEDIQMRHPPSS